MSSSVSNISFRYHPEDEDLDDNYDTFSSISTSSIKSEGTSEDNSAAGLTTDGSSSVLGRLGIREENSSDKWKLFREVKGRIAKSVEEKIEEIKTERLKKDSKHRRSVLGQMENSSVSDEEPPSESSQVSASDKSQSKSVPEVPTTPTNTVRGDRTDERQESDRSGSQESSPERSTTPVPIPEDIREEEGEVMSKKGKGLKNASKKKKGKIKSGSFSGAAGFDKTTISYSTLCNNESDDDTVEVAQEVMEPTLEETKLAKELDKLAHPTMFQRLAIFITEWHMVLLPLIAILLHWFFNLPQYVVGFLVGSIGLLVLQRINYIFQELLGFSETPIKQLKDLLPLTGMPIFRRSVYDSDVSEKSFEGWMNEFSREYHPETYHITLTETVYVRLEGSKLRLSTPRNKIPKRALWNEPRYRLLFSHERLYDIAGCRIEILPVGLIHRRIWSKKYPICIVLKPSARIGVRHKEKEQETINEEAPWVDEDKYNFDTVSEESEDEIEEERRSRKSSHISSAFDDTLSKDSEISNDFETPTGEMEAEGFVKISAAPTPQEGSYLYLFGRTDREKEIWFRRFSEAVRTPKTPKGRVSPSLLKAFKSKDSSPSRKLPIDYLSFMLQLSQRTTASLPETKENSKYNERVNTADLNISTDVMWLNAFMGRVLYDVAQDPDKIMKIQEKIQKKLSAIKLPMFLEQLEVSHLDLGVTVPVVQRASRPVLNAQGVWVDLDVVYEGGFKMTVDTKLNLDRIKQAQAESPTSDSPKSGSPAKTPTPTPTPGASAQPESQRKSAVYNSEVEDSAETSSEEPDTARLVDPSTSGQSSSIAQPKYIRFLDKVAQSKYFQQVVDYKFIKKFVQGNNLQLVVEVKGLLGTLVLNIPPPPSNRLWYGFRTNPKLWLSAQPKFGQHAVAVISRIIEKKLSLEFQRVLVLPNMDDLLIPLMSPEIPS